MQKTIQIKITNQGKAVGTAGWLAEQAASIHLGKTKDGNEGAWLCDDTGKTITCLAIRGYWLHASAEIATIDRDGSFGLGSEIPWTDAGWEAVWSLAQLAVEAIEAKLDNDDESGQPRVSVRAAV